MRAKNPFAITAAIDDEPFARPAGSAWRFVIPPLLLIQLLIGVRTWWGIHADARLRDAVDAKTPTLTLADTPVPTTAAAGENAFTALVRAGAMARVNPEGDRIMASDDWYLTLTSPDSPEGIAVRRRYLATYGPALAELRRARSLPMPTSPASQPLTPEQRALADEGQDNLVALAMAVSQATAAARAADDHAAVVAGISDMAFLARATAAGVAPGMYIRSLGFLADASLAVLGLARTLRIGDKPGDARRADVDALIRDLLDLQTFERRSPEVRAIARDLAATSARRWRPRLPPAREDRGFDLFESTRDAGPPTRAERLVTFLVRPYAVIHAAHELRRFDAMVAADIDVLTRGIAPFKLPPTLRSRTGLFGVDPVSAGMVDHYVLPLLRGHNEATGIADYAASELARRAFEVDRGYRPRRRAELIPDYLPFDSGRGGPEPPPEEGDVDPAPATRSIGPATEPAALRPG